MARSRPTSAAVLATLAFVATGVGLLLSACSPARFVPPPDAYTAGEPLIEAAAARRAGLTALSADARVEYYGREGVQKGRVVIAARRPDRVRFEALSPTGDFLAALAGDGRRFVSFQRGDDACYLGPACATNVGRLLPLALEGAAVVRVLLGEAPLILYETVGVTFNRETGRYDVELAAPSRGERERVSFETSDLAVREAVVWRHDKLLLRVEFDDLVRRGDVRVPKRIRFRMPGNDVDLSIRYREVDRDPESLTDDAFALQCPEGTVRWWMDCEGNPARPATPDEIRGAAPPDGPKEAPP